MARGSHTDDIILLRCCGDDIYPYLDDAARLRIEVFRDYPYLYDGTVTYERDYLEHYVSCPDSIFVCAMDREDVVGISTAIPLVAADEAFQKPFLDADQPIQGIFYLGESVLLPQYRGRGIGHAFFDHREAQAKRLGCKSTTFCSVIREPDHPLQPVGYRSNEVFWNKRGYQRNGLSASFDWMEIKSAEESPHEMEFWNREL